MTPEQIIQRRESRVDALIDQVESGQPITADQWRQLDQLNYLDMQSAELGGARETLEREAEADGVTRNGTEQG